MAPCRLRSSPAVVSAPTIATVLLDDQLHGGVSARAGATPLPGAGQPGGGPRLEAGAAGQKAESEQVAQRIVAGTS